MWHLPLARPMHRPVHIIEGISRKRRIIPLRTTANDQPTRTVHEARCSKMEHIRATFCSIHRIRASKALIAALNLPGPLGSTRRINPMRGGPMSNHHDEHPTLVSRNARYGLILFALYVALYAGFIYLATFQPAVLAAEAPGGANWAVAYGLGLILAAFLLAGVYMILCGRAHDDGGPQA